MKIVALIIALMFCMPGVSLSQDRIYVSGTVGTYAMRSMKDFQEDIADGMENEAIRLKPVSQFPISLQISAGYLKALNEESYAGVYVNYAFTKGRLNYSDYSGETYFDQDVGRLVLGGELRTWEENGFSFYFRTGFNYSWLNMISHTSINNGGSAEESVDFYSLGINVEPGFGWRYDITNRLALALNAGFEVNAQGKTLLKEDNNAYLLDSSGDAVKLNWSGLRVGIEMLYAFKKRP